MSSISFHLIRGGGVDNVVAYNPNSSAPLHQADSTHPNWQAILDGLMNNDESVFELFNPAAAVSTKMRVLSERVSFDGANIRFDGDAVTGPLADHLRRCIEAGNQDYRPVVSFWEKVAANPDERSREQLFSWLQSHEFSITDEGDIVGYKGVTWVNGDYHSQSSGTALVDGVRHEGRIPNRIGSVVTMPRSEVANDPSAPCSVGLHVGDWSFAKDFAQHAVLEVHVNPRDVVSIPADSGARKMRCCRYTVVGLATTPVTAPVANVNAQKES